MSSTVVRADARVLPLADESVDLVVTSPPYFALRSYTDGGEHYAGQIGSEATPAAYIAALIACTREWVRVLKPSGSIFVNLGDKYATRYSSVRGEGRAGLNDDDDSRTHDPTCQKCDAAATSGRTGPNRTGIPEKSLMLLPELYRVACVYELGLIARAVLIWPKTNCLPDPTSDRVGRVHEDWVHLTKEPRYFADLDEIRVPTARGGMTWQQRLARGDATRQGEQRGTFGDGMAPNPLGRIPSSVWEIPTEPLTVPAHLGIDHFAAFPTEWPRRIILGWSPAGGIILDPFGGTGTTALVADALGRHGISVDMSADYCRLAQWRTTDPGQRAKALGVSKPPAQLDGQADLFEGAAS